MFMWATQSLRDHKIKRSFRLGQSKWDQSSISLATNGKVKKQFCSQESTNS